MAPILPKKLLAAQPRGPTHRTPRFFIFLLGRRATSRTFVTLPVSATMEHPRRLVISFSLPVSKFEKMVVRILGSRSWPSKRLGVGRRGPKVIGMAHR